jgi:hypothetical protein
VIEVRRPGPEIGAEFPGAALQSPHPPAEDRIHRQVSIKEFAAGQEPTYRV